MASPRPDGVGMANREQVPALDGLRGLAILLVFVAHAIYPTLARALHHGTVVNDVLREITRAGWISVDLFFVISGFLITGILLDTRTTQHRWRNFFARRVLRIFPLYYGALILLFVVLPRFWSDPQFTSLQADQVWYWSYSVNMLPVISPGDWHSLSTQHFWSLAVEEQFYLLWPLVVWSCRPQILVRVAAGAILASIAFRIWLALATPFGAGTASAFYVLTPARLDGLMVGAVVAVMARTNGGLSRLRGIAPVIVLGAATLLTAIATLRGGLIYKDAVVSIAGYPVLALMLGGLLVAALTRGTVTRWFEHPVLRSLGKYSYGFYLFHLPIIGVFQWNGWLAGATLPTIALFALVTGVLSYGVAWLSYHAYEKHFLALKRYFEPSVRARPVIVPAQPQPRTSEGLALANFVERRRTPRMPAASAG